MLLYTPCANSAIEVKVGWLADWCLTALSAQQGYRAYGAMESSVLRQLWRDDHDEDEQLKQWKKLGLKYNEKKTVHMNCFV